MNNIKTIRTQLGLSLIEYNNNYYVLNEYNAIIAFLLTDEKLLINNNKVWVYYSYCNFNYFKYLLPTNVNFINKDDFAKQLANIDLEQLTLDLFLEQHN